MLLLLCFNKASGQITKPYPDPFCMTGKIQILDNSGIYYFMDTVSFCSYIGFEDSILNSYELYYIENTGKIFKALPLDSFLSGAQIYSFIQRKKEEKYSSHKIAKIIYETYLWGSLYKEDWVRVLKIL